MSSNASQWGSLTFSDTNEIRLEWDRLLIRILRRGSDLLLVENRGDTSTCIQLGTDPDSDFKRYAFQSPIDQVRVRPITPDRPIVIQPLHPLRLAPQAKVDFYVSIPLDIQLSTGEVKDGEKLERIRSEILSDTWFGDQVAGVLCYALKSRARRECPVIDSQQTARAICKIQIHNQSTDQLNCTKFCIQLDHCNLWQSGDALWTSLINIRFNGRDQLSAVDYSEKAPTEAVDAVKIASALEDPLKGLIRRTFASFSTSDT
jgi:hypothetical protein